MPPKAKIDKETLIDTAIKIVRESGGSALNAREIANRLNCSTQPIFSNFKSMNELKQEVYKSAFEYYTNHINDAIACGKYPKYKASGMAYISFAKDERELFKLLFMSKREKNEQKHDNSHWKDITSQIAESGDISIKQAEDFHSKMWIFVHGIATMCATDFLEFDEQEISAMLSDIYHPLLKAKKEENND